MQKSARPFIPAGEKDSGRSGNCHPGAPGQAGNMGRFFPPLCRLLESWLTGSPLCSLPRLGR